MTIGNLGRQVGAPHPTKRLRADPKGEAGLSRNQRQPLLAGPRLITRLRSSPVEAALQTFASL